MRAPIVCETSLMTGQLLQATKALMATVLFATALFGASCQFNPKLPPGRILCDAKKPECPRGYSCQEVLDAARKGIYVCCQSPNCGELKSIDVERINTKVREIDLRDGGTDMRDGGGDGQGGDAPATCGNGQLDQGELCEGDSCPTSCPHSGCMRRKLEGDRRNCNARCVDDVEQTACMTGDMCCPSGCAGQDEDCNNCTCGNSQIETACGEVCDPLGSCPTVCPPVRCTKRKLANAGTCQAACVDDGPVLECVSGDGCCPSGCNATLDTDCGATCGNMIREATETCDPPETCETACPALGCTLRKLEGAAATCNARCVDNGTQATCVSGDTCCPAGCTTANDKDCECKCGDGQKDEACGETCDPAGSCPQDCPPVGCQLRRLVNGGTCQAQCVNGDLQTQCMNGDGCCPSTCNANNDNDCPVRCGNGAQETGETCDPPSSCPTVCPWNGCTRRRLEGNAEMCTATCVDNGTETACANGDGCCPSDCNANNDTDCSARCGNGVVEGAEKCDGANCPTSCPAQGCQQRMLQGTASECTAECVNVAGTPACGSGDMCCPAGCNRNNDNDCACMCGNGVVETACGERCEGASCPTSCPPVGCQRRRLEGTGCAAECVNTDTQTACANGDGCCPGGCTNNNDTDCSPRCGNGAVETGETCDPQSSCQMQYDQCVSDRNFTRTRSGNAMACTFRCIETPRTCSATSDGFCPANCTACGAACNGNNQDIDCKLANGAACNHANQCTTACVDGRCCESSCTGRCQSCAVAGMLGMCRPIASGTDTNSSPVCSGTNACVSGTCKANNGQPCNAPADCVSNSCTTFYRDADSDAVGNPAMTSRVCGTSAPAGYVAVAGDCCDSDGRVNPSQTAYFPMANNCQNYDYNCSNVAERGQTTVRDCRPGICRSGWATSEPPACGTSEAWQVCVSTMGGRFCDQHAPTPQTQSCR